MNTIRPTLLLIALMTLIAGTASAQGALETIDPVDDASVGLLAADDPDVVALLGQQTLFEVAAGPEMTLSQAIAATDAANLDLEALRFEVQKADARTSMAYGALLPMLSADLTYRRADHADQMDLGASMGPLFDALGIPADQRGEPTEVASLNSVSGSMTAVVPLVNVASWLNVGVAEEAEALAELNVEDARQRLLTAAAQSHTAALLSRTLVELRRAEIDSAVRQVIVARRRVAADVGLRIDQVRAEADLALAVQNYNDAVLALESARDGLAVLTHSQAMPLPVDGSSTDRAALRTQTEAESLAARSDLEVLRKQGELAEDQLDVLWAGFAPTLSAVWQGTWQLTEPTGLGSDDSTRWTAMLTLDIPLYDGVRYGRLDEQRAAAEQLEVQLRSAELQVGQEIRQARRELFSAESAVGNAQLQLELAREALTLTMRAYEAGAGSSLEVTDSRKVVAMTQSNLVSAQLQVELARLSLTRALGLDLAEI